MISEELLGKVREDIQLKYCAWCPKVCKGLTKAEKLGCLASSGFADDILQKKFNIAGLEGLIITRPMAESLVGETDCSERKYGKDEREDLLRTLLVGAEVQLDRVVGHFVGAYAWKINIPKRSSSDD